MKKFILGFLSCFFVFLLMSFAQDAPYQKNASVTKTSNQKEKAKWVNTYTPKTETSKPVTVETIPGVKFIHGCIYIDRNYYTDDQIFRGVSDYFPDSFRSVQGSLEWAYITGQADAFEGDCIIKECEECYSGVYKLTDDLDPDYISVRDRLSRWRVIGITY